MGRETCGGSSLLHERSSLPTGDELRALVFGTCAPDPLLSGRPASTVATALKAQLCHTRRPHRSMLPVRPLSCQAGSARASNQYGTCNGLLLPETSGALPTADELYKAFFSPRPPTLLKQF